MRRHLLPHVLPSLIVQTSFMLGVALLVEAGLSFIGLGIQPPHASWGAMLTKASAYIRRQPFVIFPPGLAITFTVLALNVVGDGRPRRGRPRGPRPAQDAADPRRRSASGRRRPRSRTRPAIRRWRSTSAISRSGSRSGTSSRPSLPESACRSGGARSSGSSVSRAAARRSPRSPRSGSSTHPARSSSGSVRVDGVELVGRSERELCRLRGDEVAMVFQDPSSSLDPGPHRR